MCFFFFLFFSELLEIWHLPAKDRGVVSMLTVSTKTGN